MKRLLLFIFVSTLTVLFVTFTLKTFAEDRNLSVSALVPPNASDFQFAFTTDGTATAHQNQPLTYTITYGAKPSAGISTPTTIIVDYSQDKAPDGSHVTDYINGSASFAYGGIAPVVDPL